MKQYQNAKLYIHTVFTNQIRLFILENLLLKIFKNDNITLPIHFFSAGNKNSCKSHKDPICSNNASQTKDIGIILICRRLRII